VTVVGRPLDEAELVERAKRGDASAYRALMEMHEQIAFRTAYAVTGNAADAEEVAQDAFVKAHRALVRFRVELQHFPVRACPVDRTADVRADRRARPRRRHQSPPAVPESRRCALM
jgi:DNA-directed RNA polymerase specialized sigma24 family protein